MKVIFFLYFYFQIELNRIALPPLKCNLSKANLHQWQAIIAIKKEIKKWKIIQN